MVRDNDVAALGELCEVVFDLEVIEVAAVGEGWFVNNNPVPSSRKCLMLSPDGENGNYPRRFIVYVWSVFALLYAIGHSWGYAA